MKTFKELKEAFDVWPKIPYHIIKGIDMLYLLKDSTPITLDRLTELGVLEDLQQKLRVPQPKHVIGELEIMNIKTIGKLLMTLLITTVN